MAKKRKLKKSMMLLIGVIAFFMVYLTAFKLNESSMEKLQNNKDNKKQEQQEDDPRTLMAQIGSKKKIYISDSNVENVKVEEEAWEKIKFYFDEFSKVRTPDKYEGIYQGYSDDGIRFSTDLNYFRVYTVNKEEYYKIPIASKKEFEKLVKESIYTSFDLAKQYKTWENVTASYKNETKKISKWKYDDLSHSMLSKRVVGKIQPEKGKERSKYNFTVDISGESYKVKIETMGKDYVKITSVDTESYYEVHPRLYEYLKDEVFKLEKKK